jgi:DNA segregation ATPase FtsK/SpoIIIE-like protein
VRQAESAPQRILHHRAPRIWPTIPPEPFIIPLVKPTSGPQLSSLFVTAASILGIGLAAAFITQSGGSSGGLGLGLLLVSGATAVVSGLVALFQYVGTRRRNAQLLRLYRAELDKLIGEPGARDGSVSAALRAEAEWRRANDLPLVADNASGANVSLPPDTEPTLIEQLRRYPGKLWQRRPNDPDFLTIRLGLGRTPARTRVELGEKLPAVRLPERNAGFAQEQTRAIAFVQDAQTLEDTPVVVSLRDFTSVAIVADSSYQDTANGLTRALLSQIALLHSPYDAQITVITPEKRQSDWLWVNNLSADVERDCDALIGYGAVPANAPEPHDAQTVAKASVQIERLHALLTAREQRLLDNRTASGQPITPHLVIVIDSLLPELGQTGEQLLTLPPVALALRRGAQLGVTVISTHLNIEQAPAQCGLLIQADGRGSGEARILGPAEPHIMRIATMDRVDMQQSYRVARVLAQYQPQHDGEREIPISVDLLSLFDSARLAPATYDIDRLWKQGRRRLESGTGLSFTIPIGRSAAPDPLLLDFLSDGPHGLLIGKTGSGKSVLLQTMITALAVLYPPDKINFVLVDYKGGLGLEAYANLPHTLAFLTNLQAPGLTTRFLTMLESEIRERQEMRKNRQPMPRLFVLIDEFAEMVAQSNSDQIMDQMLRIVRLGRQLDVHLLFASQRPENKISKLQGYVQYRIAMRTNSEADSKEVIDRPDAALLPARIPGRGYLLRGDYQLQQFQAARADLPLADPEQQAQAAGIAFSEHPPATDGELIALRMAGYAPAAPQRWPSELPSPSSEAPTPMVLFHTGRLRAVQWAWASSATPSRPRPALMTAPIGRFDEPARRTQDWFEVDLLGHGGALRGGPLLVMGDLNSGKTTALQTLMLYFTMTYTPEELRVFALGPGVSFREFAAAPQARDFREARQTNIIEGENEQEYDGWSARLEALMALDPAQRPRILVVMDDFDEVSQRLSSRAMKLQALAMNLSRGQQRGIHLALAAAKLGSSSGGVTQTILNTMSTRIVLHVSGSGGMDQYLSRRVPAFAEPAPGRGYAQTRHSLQLIQIAAPTSGDSEVERAEAIRALLTRRWPG